MKGTFRLSEGETIHILVGQEGGINTVRSAAGGGGGTFVVRGSRTPLIVAGGGGGVDYSNSRYHWMRCISRHSRENWTHVIGGR